ncbi:MAG: ABC transporter permease [Bacilli bacterium]|nr:ABC transporter permease [Bacilli bacterium]
MSRYLLKRLFSLFITMLLISIMIFGIVKAMPSDPVTAYLGVGNTITEKERDEIRNKLGLNDPLVVQYTKWITRTMKGDFGTSIRYKIPVKQLMIDRLGNTLILNASALLLSLLISTVISIISFIHKSKLFASVLDMVSLFIISIPSFFFAMLFIYMVAIPVGFNHFTGLRDPYLAAFGYADIWEEIMDIVMHSILPIGVLTLIITSSFLRFIRNAMSEVESEVYIMNAKAKGISPTRIVTHHIFRNILSSLFTFLGNYFPLMFSGSLLIETLFLWPGIGQLLMESVYANDESVLCALLFLSAFITLIGYLLFDVLSIIADPRIREDRRKP